eukprot:1194728-Prorocentrum_minimum.AAC.2
MHPLEDIPSSSIAVCSDPVEKPGTRWGPSIKEPEKNWPVHWFFYAWTPSGPRFLYRIRAYCNKQSVGEILLQGSTEDCALRGAHQMDEVKEAWALQLKVDTERGAHQMDEVKEAWALQLKVDTQRPLALPVCHVQLCQHLL